MWYNMDRSGISQLGHDLRKLNSEHPESDDARKVMKFATMVLKEKGKTNFDDLGLAVGGW